MHQMSRQEVQGAIWGVHSTGTGQLVGALCTQKGDFFCRLVGQSAPTGLPIVHWIGCINAIKMTLFSL